MTAFKILLCDSWPQTNFFKHHFRPSVRQALSAGLGCFISDLLLTYAHCSYTVLEVCLFAVFVFVFLVLGFKPRVYIPGPFYFYFLF